MWSRATRITLAASCLLLAAYVVIWQLSGTWSSVNEAPFADGAVHRAQKQHESVVSAAALPPPLENKAAGGGDVDIDQSYWLASVPRKGFDLYHRKYERVVLISRGCPDPETGRSPHVEQAFHEMLQQHAGILTWVTLDPCVVPPHPQPRELHSVSLPHWCANAVAVAKAPLPPPSRGTSLLCLVKWLNKAPALRQAGGGVFIVHDNVDVVKSRGASMPKAVFSNLREAATSSLKHKRQPLLQKLRLLQLQLGIAEDWEFIRAEQYRPISEAAATDAERIALEAAGEMYGTTDSGQREAADKNSNADCAFESFSELNQIPRRFGNASITAHNSSDCGRPRSGNTSPTVATLWFEDPAYTAHLTHLAPQRQNAQQIPSSQQMSITAVVYMDRISSPNSPPANGNGQNTSFWKTRMRHFAMTLEGLAQAVLPFSPGGMDSAYACLTPPTQNATTKETFCAVPGRVRISKLIVVTEDARDVSSVLPLLTRAKDQQLKADVQIVVVVDESDVNASVVSDSSSLPGQNCPPVVKAEARSIATEADMILSCTSQCSLLETLVTSSQIERPWEPLLLLLRPGDVVHRDTIKLYARALHRTRAAVVLASYADYSNPLDVMLGIDTRKTSHHTGSADVLIEAMLQRLWSTGKSTAYSAVSPLAPPPGGFIEAALTGSLPGFLAGAMLNVSQFKQPGTKPSSKNVLENSFSNRQHADLVCGLSNYPGFGLAQGLREWLVTKLVKDLPPQRQPGKGVRSEVGKITPCNCSGALGDAATGKVASNICWCMLSRPNGPERFDQAEFSRLVQVIPLPLRHRFVPELRGLSHANAQEELVERPAGSLLKQNMMTLAQLIPLQNRFPSVAGYIELVRAQGMANVPTLMEFPQLADEAFPVETLPHSAYKHDLSQSDRVVLDTFTTHHNDWQPGEKSVVQGREGWFFMFNYSLSVSLPERTVYLGHQVVKAVRAEILQLGSRLGESEPWMFDPSPLIANEGAQGNLKVHFSLGEAEPPLTTRQDTRGIPDTTQEEKQLQDAISSAMQQCAQTSFFAMVAARHGGTLPSDGDAGTPPAFIFIRSIRGQKLPAVNCNLPLSRDAFSNAWSATSLPGTVTISPVLATTLVPDTTTASGDDVWKRIVRMRARMTCPLLLPPSERRSGQFSARKVIQSSTLSLSVHRVPQRQSASGSPVLPCHGVNEGIASVQIASWDMCTNDDDKALRSNDGSALKETYFDFAAEEAMEKIRSIEDVANSNQTSSLVACVQLQPGSVRVSGSDGSDQHEAQGVSHSFEFTMMRDFSDAINRVSLHMDVIGSNAEVFDPRRPSEKDSGMLDGMWQVGQHLEPELKGFTDAGFMRMGSRYLFNAHNAFVATTTSFESRCKKRPCAPARRWTPKLERIIDRQQNGAGNRINATCVDVTFVSISGSDLCTCENTMAKASGAKLSVVDATAAVAAGTAQRPVLLLRQGNRTLRSSLAFDTVEEKTEDEESLARRKQRALVGVVEQHQEELSGHRLRRPRTEVRRFRAMVKRGETIEVAMDGFPHGAEDFCKHVVQCTANYHLFLHPCRGEA